MSDDSSKGKVFVNCPFDAACAMMFEAIVIAACGLRTSSALGEADSGDVRLLKVVRLFQERSPTPARLRREQVAELKFTDRLRFGDEFFGLETA